MAPTRGMCRADASLGSEEVVSATRRVVRFDDGVESSREVGVDVIVGLILEFEEMVER